MEKLNIIELIANTEFNADSFHELIDPAGSLAKERKQYYRSRFESGQQNLVSFYKELEGEESEVEYIKRNINHFFDQKVAKRMEDLRTELKEQESPGRKIKPIDDLEGSDSWGFNDDVKWK